MCVCAYTCAWVIVSVKSNTNFGGWSISIFVVFFIELLVVSTIFETQSSERKRVNRCRCSMFSDIEVKCTSEIRLDYSTGQNWSHIIKLFTRLTNMLTKLWITPTVLSHKMHFITSSSNKLTCITLYSSSTFLNALKKTLKTEWIPVRAFLNQIYCNVFELESSWWMRIYLIHSVDVCVNLFSSLQPLLLKCELQPLIKPNSFMANKSAH